MTEVTIKPKSNPTPDVVHKIGNWYKHPDHGLMVLAADWNHIGLVCPDGDMFDDMIPLEEIGDMYNLTDEEMDRICSGNFEEFKFVKSVTISEE